MWSSSPENRPGYGLHNDRVHGMDGTRILILGLDPQGSALGYLRISPSRGPLRRDRAWQPLSQVRQGLSAPCFCQQEMAAPELLQSPVLPARSGPRTRCANHGAKHIEMP